MPITSDQGIYKRSDTKQVFTQVEKVEKQPDSRWVDMTYAASGSSGITVADNDNIDFGTGNFTLVWRGSLPDWTPAADQLLCGKWDGVNGYRLYLLNTGALMVYLNAVTPTASVVTGITDGTVAEIVAVVTRETDAAAGSVVFYINGVQCGASAVLSIDATPDSTNCSTAFYCLGASTSRTAGTCSFAATYNRALTAAEVLDLYRNGINYADKWGSQTELINDIHNRDFSNTNEWSNNGLPSFNSTGDLSITANAAGQGAYLLSPYLPYTIGKKYRLSFDCANIVGTWSLRDAVAGEVLGTISTNGAGQRIEFSPTAVTCNGIYIMSLASNSSGDFDNFSLVEIGATLALEPEGITGTDWFDSSTNHLDAAYPTYGSQAFIRK
jgi:hypothetical protein